MAKRPLHISSFPAAWAKVDLASFAAELDTTLRTHGAHTQPHPIDLTLSLKGPLKAIASFVVESDRIERAVVTHMRMAPFFAGIAMVIHPKPEIDAPLLVADMMIPPPGFTRAYVDTCGPAITGASFAEFKAPLGEILDGARDVQRMDVPGWIAPLSGGAGARLRAKAGRGESVSRVFLRYVDRYLDALAAAPRARSAEANRESARAVAAAVRANGPAGRHLTRAFGESFASRYLALLWET